MSSFLDTSGSILWFSFMFQVTSTQLKLTISCIKTSKVFIVGSATKQYQGSGLGTCVGGGGGCFVCFAFLLHDLNIAAIAPSITSTLDDIQRHEGKECSPCVSFFARKKNSSRKPLRVP